MISFTNVSKSYSTQFGIIDVSFEIKAGDMVLFIGENGSGKSTCLKLIGKSIFLGRKDYGNIVNSFKSVAYLPEKFSLPSLITTKDYLKMYSKLHMSKVDYNEMLKKYNLSNKLICNLSKGMLQKLGIILTLITPSDLYLFDEPTDGLDKESRIMFQDDILKLKALGKTVIISTHNKSYFKELRPTTILFQGGRLCYSKKDSKILN